MEESGETMDPKGGEGEMHSMTESEGRQTRGALGIHREAGVWEPSEGAGQGLWARPGSLVEAGRHRGGLLPDTV